MHFIHTSRQNSLTIVFLAFLFFLHGCVAVQPFPMAARAGDSVTLAVGSPDVMTTENTTLIFIPDGGASESLPIRSIFKILPDLTSGVATSGFVPMGQGYSSHSQTLTMILADIPAGWSPGAGVVQIQTTAEYGGRSNNPDINTVEIPLEILPGTGESNPFAVHSPFQGQIWNATFSDLEPQEQVIVTIPPNNNPYTGSAGFASAEIKVNVPIRNRQNGNMAPDGQILVINDLIYPDNYRTQMSVNWRREGDVFTVYLFGPTESKYAWQTRFSILYYPATNTVSDPGALQVLSANFYDQDGNPVLSMPDASTFQISQEYAQ